MTLNKYLRRICLVWVVWEDTRLERKRLSTADCMRDRKLHPRAYSLLPFPPGAPGILEAMKPDFGESMPFPWSFRSEAESCTDHGSSMSMPV